MSVSYHTGWEHGVDPVTRGGGLANTVVGTPIVVSTASPPYGTYSLACDAVSATTEYIFSPTFTAQAQGSIRFRFKCSAAPSASQDMFQIRLGGSVFCLVQCNSAGALKTTFVGGTGPVAGANVAATPGAWHLVDLYLDASTTSYLAKLTVDGVANASNATTTGAAAGSFTAVDLGKVSSETLVTSRIFYYDDLIVTTTASDYPLGDGKGIWRSLGSDGLHQPEFPDCFSGTTSYTALDRTPFTSTLNSAGTEAIAQNDSSSPHNLHYLQFKISPTPETNSAKAVTCLVGYGGADATANNGTTRVRNADGTLTTVYAGDMSETSMFFRKAVVTKPLSWTPLEVDNLVAEIGLSSSVANPPIWQEIGFELDYSIGIQEDAGQGTITVTGSGVESYHWGGDLPGTLQGVWQPYETYFKPSRLIKAPVIPAGLFVDAMSGTIRLSGSGIEDYTPPVQHIRGTLVDAFTSGGMLTLIISLEQGTLTISTPNRGPLT